VAGSFSGGKEEAFDLRQAKSTEMAAKLHGVIPALTTPFDDQGEIDENKFLDQTAFMLRKGVHGICVGDCWI